MWEFIVHDIRVERCVCVCVRVRVLDVGLTLGPYFTYVTRYSG
jgi:hypothetical protein